jgi:hypothetical protein
MVEVFEQKAIAFPIPDFYWVSHFYFDGKGLFPVY